MSETRRLDSIADIRRGASPRPIGDPKYFGGDVGWVRIVDVTRSQRFLRETEQYVSPLGESLSVRVNPGDLIMSICGTVGKPIIVDMPACIHDGFVQFRNIREADTTYLFYALQNSERAFQGMGQPGTQTNLNTSIVGRHEIFFPSISRQRRIAEILSTVDEAIDHTEALIAKTQQIKTGLMHDLFTRGVTPDGRLRPPRDQAPELYKQSPLGWIPREWEISTVNTLCSRITVGIVVQPAQYYADEGIPALRSANIREHGIDDRNLVFICPGQNALLASSILRAGDVVTVRTGYPGTSAVVPPEFDGANCVDVLISRPVDGIEPEFLTFWINSPFGKDQVLKRQGGLAQQHFNVGELRELEILLPPTTERTSIIRKTEAAEHKLRLDNRRVEKLKMLKTGLLGSLLSRTPERLFTNTAKAGDV